MNRQVVTFRVEEQLFGIDILFVREIDRELECTRVQLAAPYILGLANLRGQIVTVVDLARRLELTSAEIESERHDIVLKTDAELSELRHRENREDLRAWKDPIGLRVGELWDIVELAEQSVERVPANLSELRADFVSGVAMISQGLVVLLDPVGLVGCDDPGGRALPGMRQARMS